ncbi:MAG: ABC transporter permease subunit [Actinomycetota bacterium]|jgi:sulfonate transport system permease protein|nr:ABC transporter permease subunit [Actinomycetota bacterium]
MVVLLAVTWELVAHYAVTRIGTSGEPIFPSLEYLAKDSFLQMSNYWSGGWGAPSPGNGGTQTYLGAVLALASASFASFGRLFAGVGLGFVLGVVLGLAVSASKAARSVLSSPVHFLRMVPFLALAPLFEVWFGKSDIGAIVFIGYGSLVVTFVGIVNAVGLVPAVQLARARTEGATRRQIYRWVILPSIVPAMRATILVIIGLGWTLDVAAEMLGAQSGLGVIMEYALRFAYTGRVILVSFVYLVYAAASFYAVQWLTGWAIRWHPSQAKARRRRRFSVKPALALK